MSSSVLAPRMGAAEAVDRFRRLVRSFPWLTARDLRNAGLSEQLLGERLDANMLHEWQVDRLNDLCDLLEVLRGADRARTMVCLRVEQLEGRKATQTPAVSGGSLFFILGTPGRKSALQLIAEGDADLAIQVARQIPRANRRVGMRLLLRRSTSTT